MKCYLAEGIASHSAVMNSEIERGTCGAVEPSKYFGSDSQFGV
jgi:hypothetical protein